MADLRINSGLLQAIANPSFRNVGLEAQQIQQGRLQNQLLGSRVEDEERLRLQEQATQTRQQEASLLGSKFASAQFGGPDTQLGALALKDPELALKLATVFKIPFGRMDKLKAIADDAKLMVALSDGVQGGTGPSQAFQYAFATQVEREGRGIKSPALREFTDKFVKDPNGAIEDLNLAHDAFIKAGLTKAPPKPDEPDEPEISKSEFLEDGTSVQVFKDGSTRVVDPEGKSLVGKARTAAIKKGRQEGIVSKADAGLLIEQKRQSIKLGREAFTKIQPIRKNILALNRGIELLDDGAGTGPVEKLFPSFKASSIELGNLRNQLGLNVISGVTLGAINVRELELALEVGLPLGLDEEPLRAVIVNKIAAQKKLLKALIKQARFFSRGGTIDELLAQDENQGLSPQVITAPDSAIPTTTPDAGIPTTGSFTSSGGITFTVK